MSKLHFDMVADVNGPLHNLQSYSCKLHSEKMIDVNALF